MKTDYTLEELALSETYDGDPKLTTLGRRVSDANFDKLAAGQMGRGEFKRAILNGQYPKLVYDRLQEIRKELDEETRRLFKQNAKNQKAIEKLLQLDIDGFSFDLLEAGYVAIKAPWDGYDLGKRLKRLGAYWDRDNKRWNVPVQKAASLTRIIANWQKSQAIVAEEKAAERAQWQAKKEERNRQYALERQRERQQREADRKARKKAVAERILVTVGQHSVGDMINDKQITGFGKSWTESRLSSGQLYQECDYGRCPNEPVCVTCEKCAKHCTCGHDQIELCYAYFG